MEIEGYEIDDGNNDIHINLVVFCVLTFRKYGLKSTPQEADQNLTHNDYHLFIEEKAKKRPEEPAEIEDQEKEPAGPVEFFVNDTRTIQTIGNSHTIARKISKA